ncbi:MAG: hypothetical protein NPINA01_18610 [Nitrospinaceae bacterium]|nr:MAG: hypothetical protein NPINA01_18610 [Nitrospinaceae bacterium]
MNGRKIQCLKAKKIISITIIIMVRIMTIMNILMGTAVTVEPMPVIPQ